jgi:hypothetical protein
MASKIFLLPVPAGNTEALKAKFADMAGSREGQCVANRSVMGVTREYVALQQTPNGDVIVAYLEGDDPDKGMERMMASDSEYARWIASEVMPLMGTDTDHNLPSAQVLADWRA